MDRCRRSLQDLNALDLRQMKRDISVEMSGQRVVQANSVDHHQHLLKGSSPDDDIRLRTLRSTLLHLNAG